MGIIVFGRALRDDEQRRIEARLKLYDDARKQYLADGCSEDEANARAFVRVRENSKTH
jgi:hypothetical protein